MTQSDQFGAMMGQATKMNLVAQKILAERMEAMLAALNMPTKSQVELLGERLDRIEDNIERLRLFIERETTREPKFELSRTRKPPKHSK